MDKYNTIKFETSEQLLVKKSTFISYMYKVNSVDEVNVLLNKLRESHKKARHICFAYIIDDVYKYYDDNEPKNTAGLPIFTMLDKNKLNHILCVVVRYFGGILLGSSKLYKAYMDCAILSLDSNEIIIEEKRFTYILEFDYDIVNLVNNILDTTSILNKSFLNKVIYKVSITNFVYEQLLLTKKINIIKEE